MFIYKIHRFLVFGLRSSVFDYNLKLAFLVIALLLTAHILPLTASAQTVPTPQSILGFRPTDDKTIADWNQILDYFAKLDAASDRVKVEEIGKTTLGKPQIVAYISSAENIKNLEKYKKLNQQLANPTSISENDKFAFYRNFIGNGKAIVAISCSIHSTEIVASQMSMLLAYQLATAPGDSNLEVLDNT
ncbi:MAG: M14 family zinc carboxypeptidase, partial [Aridibacter sp.]